MQRRIQEQLCAQLGIMKGDRDGRCIARTDIISPSGVIYDDKRTALHQRLQETGKQHNAKTSLEFSAPDESKIFHNR